MNSFLLNETKAVALKMGSSSSLTLGKRVGSNLSDSLMLYWLYRLKIYFTGSLSCITCNVVLLIECNFIISNSPLSKEYKSHLTTWGKAYCASGTGN